jgi:enoyl-CoA hydratase
MIDDERLWDKTAREAKQIIFSLLDCQKPVVAKLNGHAIGLGATIALFCDVIFASPVVKIGDPHVCVGLVAGDGGAVIWPQLVGFVRAKEYLLSGDLLLATEAERIGLINHVIAADQLDTYVAQFAKRLADGAMQAICWTKTAVNIGLRQLASSIMDASIAYEGRSNATRDHQEAVLAFQQKRRPGFNGT